MTDTDTSRWQFIIGDGGQEQAELVDATSRQVTWRVDAAAEASFDLPGSSPRAGAITELVTDLHVRLDGDKLYRGRVGGTSDTLDADQHKVSVQTADYRAVLGRRILWSDDTLVYTADDQSDIFWGLINDTQARDGGDLSITRGLGTVTGVTRDRTFEAGKNIGEALTQLGEVIDGFDWDIDANLQANVYYPERGGNAGVVLDYGGAVTGVTRQVDPSTFFTALRFNGADGLVAAEVVAADITTRQEGRWDFQQGETDIAEQATVDDRAERLLDLGQVISPAYTLRLKRGFWQGPSHIWLGDTCRIIVRSLPRLDVNATARVYEIKASIDDNGDADIDLTIGAPVPSLWRRLPTLSRRLTDLERR